jgi:hypothetical protein
LITFTKFAGIDPEVRYEDIRYSADGQPLDYQDFSYLTLSGGFENVYTYPLVRSWYMGLQITF